MHWGLISDKVKGVKTKEVSPFIGNRLVLYNQMLR